MGLAFPGLCPSVSSFRVFSLLASRLILSSIFFLLLSTSICGQESGIKAEEIGNSAESLVSTLDIVILVSVLGLASWYVFIRDKDPDFKQSYVTLSEPDAGKQTEGEQTLVAKLKARNRKVVVFYGSQTGTAEDFATRLAKEASKYGVSGLAMDPEEVGDNDDLAHLHELEDHLAIFCMATYGEGDPTDNAHEFKEWLDEGTSDLTGLNYAVFGLGNKTYEHYNAMGKYVDKRLEELGATRVYELGLGDDDGNIEEDFINWREGFWPTVAAHKNWKLVEEKEGIRQFDLTLHDLDSLQPTQYFKGEPARLQSFVKQKPPFDAKNPFLAPIKEHRELHSSSSDRSCMHIEFDLEGSRLRYDAGDHLAVFPTNDSKLVDRIGELLGADLDELITLTNTDEDAKKKHPFPCPCTYRTALTHYLDINNPPRTNVLRELSLHASDPEEAAKLKSMGSGLDKEGYNDWVVDKARNIVAILEDLPSCKPPVDLICELLPRLQARYYSISSSPHMYKKSVTITAIWTTGKTKTGRTFNGVATTYLKQKEPITKMVDGVEEVIRPTVPVFVRKSAFRLPYRHQTPVIMVGPGTGLAPFMGFIQERDKHRRDGKPVGETILYFGCRNQSVDFIYEKELRQFEADGTVSQLHLAFSRDSEKKVYVQNLLEQNKQETWALLQKGAHFYICGDAKYMARDVRTVLEDAIKECGGYTTQQVADYLKQMQVKGKLQLDVWS